MSADIPHNASTIIGRMIDVEVEYRTGETIKSDFTRVDLNVVVAFRWNGTVNQIGIPASMLYEKDPAITAKEIAWRIAALIADHIGTIKETKGPGYTGRDPVA